MPRLKKYLIIACLLIVTLFNQSCATPATPTAAFTPVIVMTEEPSLEMPTTTPSAPSLTIDPAFQRGQVIPLSVGDVFAISVPPGSSIWKVAYAAEVVEPLTPADKMTEPGSQGWLFRAVAAGQTDIRLTAPAPACAKPPCPPAAPMVFVFTVDVK
ncbi:MAG TPA: hypothetical protein PKE35_13685 [Anaerolineales bacterium]|nr:hypothetical protein [Anaerolineales bacterium]HMV96972.1 hypothetical protein [Anaerolineales bacterium]HMX75302.1 hypothetical protein [Anaerolineales bacterium]HMZ44268.1 hypothetical protein [Anaerolineales bacterium]HNA55824.1 hypothetical protein [Anaerolineales bacterium]